MLYHPKMGKLLAKEGNVTKVPAHTYGERERERERERARLGCREVLYFWLLLFPVNITKWTCKSK